MLEQKIEKTNELLAAILEQLSGGATPASSKPAPKTTKAAASKSDSDPDDGPDGVSRSEMNVAVQEYSKKLGKDKAKALIKDVGKAAKLADVDPEHFKAMYDACQKAVEGDDAPEQEHTREEMEAKLKELKDATSAAVAKEIVASSGVVKMADIPEDKIDEVYDAAVAKLEESSEEDDI